MNDAIVFGCGDYFKKKKETIYSLYNIVAIIDNLKQGEIVLDNGKRISIYSPQDGLKKFSDIPIVIAIQNFVIIANQLLGLGVSPEKIIFSQNMKPYGSEAIVFNEHKKIFLQKSGFFYQKEEEKIPFSCWEEFNTICYKEERRYKKEIFKASYNEIEKMNLQIPKPITSEVCLQNDFYGNAYCIKNYCSMNENYYIKAAIEHACYMGENYVWDEDVNSIFKSIITLSPKRKEILEKVTEKKVFTVGPYIAYAGYSRSKNELDDEKKKLGRTLVVFPSHSTDIVKMNFDFNLFVNEIKNFSTEFDTIRICVHYTDILKNKHLMYKKAGFHIVSAGHIYDTLFLPRLKSILYCSDMIMSNDAGSYIGQAAYLNKPCYLYRQKLHVDETENKEDIREYLIRNDDKFYNDLFEKFNKPQDYISKEQRDVINYGWGVNLVKDKSTMKKILGEIEEIWKNK